MFGRLGAVATWARELEAMPVAATVKPIAFKKFRRVVVIVYDSFFNQLLLLYHKSV
jgi:hypothetical protein